MNPRPSYLVELSGHVAFDIGKKFSLVAGQVVGFGRDFVDGDDEGALVAVLLHQEVFQAEVEAWVWDHVHVRNEGEVGLAAALGNVAHQVLGILQRGSPLLVLSRLGRKN